MAQFTTYLSFDGNCREAMHFYEVALKGKLQALLTNDDTPVADQAPPGNEDRIMHAYLVADGFVLMAGDSLVGQKYEGIKGLQLTLTYDNAAQARTTFDALADGGKVNMPFQKTFWAEGAGMVVDKFGTPWIVNGGSPSDAAGG
jgi:PhnB protein